MYYKQCKLKKATTVETAWIPEYLAKVGKYVTIKAEADIWEDGWQILEVGTRESEEYVLLHERDYRTSRIATDQARASDGRWKKVE